MIKYGDFTDLSGLVFKRLTRMNKDIIQIVANLKIRFFCCQEFSQPNKFVNRLKVILAVRTPDLIHSSLLSVFY
jgi:hypothetical protein